jgi:NodT family efflux transporter outer membrane factor (OMF) lipoprotein
MVGPNYVKPEAQEPGSWMEKEEPQIKSETADFSQWWTVFNDPILNTLVEQAYQQNLPLRAAGIRILEARARLGIAVGNLYPQQQFGSGALSYNSVSEHTANTFPGFEDGFGQVDIGFDATWEMDFWGKFRRAIQFSMGNFEASVADYDDILVTLTAEVARTYIVIRTLEMRLDIAQQNVKLQARSLQIAEVRFKAGEVTELDVAQAKSLLKDTESLIPRLATSLRQAKNSLSILLGQLPGETDSILGEPQLIPSVPAEVAVGIPADLLRRRPDIRLAERRLAAQSSRIGFAKADLYPHFFLFGSLGLSASDAAVTAAGFPGGSSLGDIFSGEALQFFGGTGFTWDILNYGRIKNRVRVQDARFQQLAVTYKDTVLNAVREMEDAIVSFLRTQEEEVFLQESVDAAKRSVDLSMIQYKEGLVSYQRVLDTQRFLALQQDVLTSTVGDVGTSLIAMYKAMGGGWEFRAGKDFVPEATKEEMSNRTDWGQLLTPEEVKPQPRPPEEEEKLWLGPDW